MLGTVLGRRAAAPNKTIKIPYAHRAYVLLKNVFMSFLKWKGWTSKSRNKSVFKISFKKRKFVSNSYYIL